MFSIPLIFALIIAVVLLLKHFADISYTRTPSHSPTADQRGIIGENTVSRYIGHTVENEKYVIENLILTDDDKSSQIDHIVINPMGIFVIETKNYSGSIYGSENQQEWTQVLQYGKIKNKFYNPLKQNASHIYRIKKIVGNLPIKSLVVFVQDNPLYTDAKNAIPISQLKQTLQTGEVVLTADEMKNAYETLLSHKSTISLEDHINNIKEQQRNLDLGICPRCGAYLVVRKGKHGEFWGCKNYPKCKFTKQIDKS